MFPSHVKLFCKGIENIHKIIVECFVNINIIKYVSGCFVGKLFSSKHFKVYTKHSNFKQVANPYLIFNGLPREYTFNTSIIPYACNQHVETNIHH